MARGCERTTHADPPNTLQCTYLKRGRAPQRRRQSHVWPRISCCSMPSAPALRWWPRWALRCCPPPPKPTPHLWAQDRGGGVTSTLSYDAAPHHAQHSTHPAWTHTTLITYVPMALCLFHGLSWCMGSTYSGCCVRAYVQHVLSHVLPLTLASVTRPPRQAVHPHSVHNCVQF